MHNKLFAVKLFEVAVELEKAAIYILLLSVLAGRSEKIK
jgi:hypothetical protein